MLALYFFAGCFASIQTSYLMHLCLGFLSSNGSFMMKYFSYRQNKWVPTIILKKNKNRWHNIFYVLWDTTCRSFSHFVLFLWFFSKENFMLFDLFYIFIFNIVTNIYKNAILFLLCIFLNILFSSFSPQNHKINVIFFITINENIDINRKWRQQINQTLLWTCFI